MLPEQLCDECKEQATAAGVAPTPSFAERVTVEQLWADWSECPPTVVIHAMVLVGGRLRMRGLCKRHALAAKAVLDDQCGIHGEKLKQYGDALHALRTALGGLGALLLLLLGSCALPMDDARDVCRSAPDELCEVRPAAVTDAERPDLLMDVAEHALHHREEAAGAQPACWLELADLGWHQLDADELRPWCGDRGGLDVPRGCMYYVVDQAEHRYPRIALERSADPGPLTALWLDGCTRVR